MAGIAAHQDIIVLFNPTSIRDTNYWYSPAVDGRNYSKRTILVNNKLDQALIVEIEVSLDGGVTWNYFEQLTSSATAGQAVGFGPGFNIRNTSLTPLPLWRLRLKAGTAPTTGTVNAWCVQYSF